MRRGKKQLTAACRTVIEALEARLLLSNGIFSTDQDIGSPQQAGSLNYSNGSYTVAGGGAGFGDTSDQLNFAYLNESGSFTIVADLKSMGGTGSAAAGLMIRNDINANSAFVSAAVTPSNLLEFITRSSDGASSDQSSVLAISAPQFLELTLAGGTITAAYSSTGANWTTAGSAQITLGSNVLTGLTVTSQNNNAALNTATFANVSVVSMGFSDIDIGSPGLPGSALYNGASNTFTISGDGLGIGGTSDQFNFANRSLTGGGSVVALIDSVSGADSATSAGVMIRSDTSASPVFASLNETEQGQLVFQWRTSSGSASSSTAVSAPSGPVWLEVIQQGGNLIAGYSTNDSSWTQVGSSQAISMTSATALAGLDIFSGDDTSLGSATFSETSVLPGGFSDTDIGSPNLGGSDVYDTPSGTDTIFSSGAGVSGTSDQFNFADTPMDGNGSVLAYVNSILSTSSSAEAGVMLRANDSAGSPFAAVLVSLGGGVTFEWRKTEGGSAAGTEIALGNGTALVPPMGLKLIRSGNTFSGFYSTDGVTWVQVGTNQTFAINPDLLGGLAVAGGQNGTPCTAAISSVGIGASPPPGAGIYSTTDQLFLDNLEEDEFDYFYDEANATSGLVPDNGNANGGGDSADSSIAADGFDLSALTIGDARGWVSHSAAYQRALTTINFLYNDGAGLDGYFYHFLNPSTGANYGGSELSSVDTAELMAGVLTVAQYWAGTPLQTAALQLYDRVQWSFMQESNGQFYGAYYTSSGYSGGYGDFSEAAVLYLLAVGSPSHPVAPSSWDSWSRTPVVNYDGFTFVTADDAALFTTQYPQAWFNLQGMEDNTGFNFYADSQTATLAQRLMSQNLNSEFSDYNLNFWGLTAGEGINGYTVFGGPPPSSNIDGTVLPTAPGGSLEFEPRYSLNDLENMKALYGSTVYQKYGFVDAFNPLKNWVSPLVLGIDVGMTLISAENSRSNLVWNTFMGNGAAQQAEAVAGFHPVSDNAHYTVNTLADSAGGTDVVDLRQAITNANASGGNQIIDLAAGLNGTLTLTTPLPAITCNLTLIGPSGSTVTLSALGTGSILTFNSGGSATLENLNVAGGITNLGNLTIAGNVTLGQITGTGSLTIGTSSSNAMLAFSGSQIDQQNSLTILSESTVDIGRSELLIQYGSGADPIAALASDIGNGYNNGLWDGVGLTSSFVAGETPGVYGVGYADGADGVVSGLSSGQIEIIPALLGDAQLAGTVNFYDFQLVLSNFGKSSQGWDDGDFDYSGTVDFYDFQAVLSNFGQGFVLNLGGSQTGSALPVVGNPFEPSRESSAAAGNMAASDADDAILSGNSAESPLIELQ